MSGQEHSRSLHSVPAPSRVLPFVPRAELTFGIYPGGLLESPDELISGRPDLPEEVNKALDTLQSGRPFVVRTYLRYTGSHRDCQTNSRSDERLASYAIHGRKLDLVLSNWDRTGNLAGWLTFIQNSVKRYGEHLHSLQICEEPNLFEYPGDGRFGHSVEAVCAGISAGRDFLHSNGLRSGIGFNSVPSDLYNDGFWQGLAPKVNAAFLNALDYVGLNLYIDVGEPLVGAVEDAIEKALIHFRNDCLAQAGIPATVPIHISESGWPTGPGRFYTRQADVLESVVTKIHELRNELNINQFELFCLRDADTANPEVRKQFGVMRDDYTPKPAFETYRRLIQKFSA